MDNANLVRGLRRLRDVAGTVAVGTVGGSVAAVSMITPSAGGAIGATNVPRVRAPRSLTNCPLT